jgi:inositol-phosphate phosphatase / L-galactose 1-phosphate phosphatase / histidinol-phosphatase
MSLPTEAQLSGALALAEQLADVARDLALRHFRAPLDVERKSDGSPVTIADRAIETEMRRLIRATYPAHAIRGEEFAAEGDGEFTWVLDPIDGTKSFVTGYPLFGSLIGLVAGGCSVLGVVEAPALAERWVGAKGRATLFNGRPAHTRECARLAEAVMYTTTPDSFTGPDRQRLESLGSRTALRRYGGDCYLFGMLASGHCDLVVEVQLKAHDFMAVLPVIQGAGGWVSDWAGRPLSFASDGRLVAAATEQLWREALAVLAA